MAEPFKGSLKLFWEMGMSNRKFLPGALVLFFLIGAMGYARSARRIVYREEPTPDACTDHLEACRYFGQGCQKGDTYSPL